MKKKTSPLEIPESDPAAIKLSLHQPGQEREEFEFHKTFLIGRDESCEVRIMGMGVSRKHAQVYFEKGRWWIKDLKSANGTYLNGERIDFIPLGKSTKVELGKDDATIIFSVEAFSAEAATVREKPPSVTQYIKRYFNNAPGEKPGEHTLLIRGAYEVVRKKQKYKYFVIIAAVLLLAVIFGIYSFIQHQQVQKQKALAEQIFYSMKRMELELSHLQSQAQQTGNETAVKEISRNQAQRQELVRNYEKLLEELHFYESSEWSEKDRIILQVARAFGECELAMPSEFVREVNKYIKKWKTTERLSTAVERAVKNGYPQIVSRIMLEQHLPPQFFYLALQESNFEIHTIGPKTRFGIAKGIWQFIPATAARYGLRNGPLISLRRYDPKDDRFNFEKSTRAASRYIRDIYETEAQASGLLVIASYNWGERRVRDLLRRMPENPKQRNFWELLKLYKKEIPRETYDYVFYIISAAVIGENPRLFGFDFEKPLNFSLDQVPG